MKAQPELTIPKVSEAKNKQWKAPINIKLYDRSPCLTKSESAEIKLVLERNKKWLAKSHRELERVYPTKSEKCDSLLFKSEA